MPRLVLAITLGTFVLTAILFQAIPKGFFPIGGYRPDLRRSTVGPDDASFDAMVARQAALAEIIKRDPDVVSVISTVGGGNAAATVNSGPHLHHAARQAGAHGRAPTQVIARLRRADGRPCRASTCFFQPVQSDQYRYARQSRAQYQFGMRSSDLSGAARVRAPHGGAHAAASRPSSRRQLRSAGRPARSVIDIDRDIGLAARPSVDQIRLPLYSAFGTRQVSTIYAPDDTYQVILEADPRYADINEVLRLHPASARRVARSCRSTPWPSATTSATALTVNQIGQLPAVTISYNLPPGVALGEAVQEIDGRCDRSSACRNRSAISFEGTAQAFQQAVANQGMPAVRRRAGDLHRAGHPLRELHPPAHHPVRPAFGRHRRAGER